MGSYFSYESVNQSESGPNEERRTEIDASSGSSLKPWVRFQYNAKKIEEQMTGSIEDNIEEQLKEQLDEPENKQL